MIKMQVIGNLGKDAMSNVVNGKTVINFNVAHTEKYRDSSGANKENTTWVECAYWTDRTAILPYLLKGTQVYVEGAPDVRHFTRNDGTGGAALTLRVFNVQLLGSGGSAGPGGSGGSGGQNTSQSKASTPSQPQAAPKDEDSGDSQAEDDLPF